jgi:hypothetical protein
MTSPYTEQVRVRDCTCPGTPHNGEGDWIALTPTLSLEGGLAAEGDLRAVALIRDENERSEALQRRWLITFVRYGAKAWNFVDEEGNEQPFDIEAILADYGIAQPVANRAADLYTDSVLRPFQKRLAARSPTGPTNGSTSARPASTRSRSKPSSPATTADTPPSAP